MDCSTAREALSARIDGEREPIPAARVDEHLSGCESCRVWQAAAVEQTQMFRRLAGRSQVSAVRTAPQRQPERKPRVPRSWPRWALGGVGAVQLAMAAAQGLGAPLGLPHAEVGHVLNESTAWSAALGVVMLVAAIRPTVAGGLAWVLAAFSGFLVLYEITDTDAGRISLDRTLSHLPVLAAAVLAYLVLRRDRSEPPPPHGTAAVLTDEIDLPDNASRGRRRGHLRSTDGSAA